MFIRKLIYTLFLLTVAEYSYCQIDTSNVEGKRILIYSQGQSYLEPLVVSTIQNLENINDGQKYFTKVNSLNNFIQDKRFQEVMSDIVSLQKPNGQGLSYSYTPSQDEVRRRIFEVLVDYDFLLVVNTNPLVELIEFQFKLFPTNKTKISDTEVNAPITITDKNMAVENFFINPKMDGYKEEIVNAIQRLFKGTNKPPIANLSIFSRHINDKDIINVPIDTEFLIDASASGDYDNKNIIYMWESVPISGKSYQSYNKINFKEKQSIQKVKLTEEGLYKFEFSVSDGINTTLPISIFLQTVDRLPKLPTIQRVIRSFAYQSLENLSIPQVQEASTYYYKSEEIKKISSNNILLSNRELGRKLNYTKDSKALQNIQVDTTFSADFSEIKFSTTFDIPESKRIEVKYFYIQGKDSLLSDAVLLKHQLIKKSAFEPSLSYIASVLKGTDEYRVNNEGDTLRGGGYIADELILNFGVYITKNIEFEIGVPLIQSGTTSFDDFEITYPSRFQFGGIYSFPFKSFVDFKAGIFSKLYNYEIISKEETNVTMGINPMASFGVSFRIKNYLDVSISTFIQYERFFKSEFSSLYGYGVGYKLAIRI